MTSGLFCCSVEFGRYGPCRLEDIEHLPSHPAQLVFTGLERLGADGICP